VVATIDGAGREADRGRQAQIEWAHTYDGFRRLAGSPEELARLLRGPRDSYATTRAVPAWCGVDLLRGWAFYLARADRQAGGGTLDGEWGAVLRALAVRQDMAPGERPPGVFGAAPGRPTPRLPTVFSSKPKQHRDADFLTAKRRRLRDDHVAPINDFVDRIREQIQEEHVAAAGQQAPEVFVPYVDPDSGGIHARVLIVLESPAGPAALGSGMLSADNDDETAKNVWQAYAGSGMPRTHGLHWNAVPWYVGDGRRNAGVTPAQVERGRDFLLRLLDLAPDVRVVVAMGKPAQRSIAGAAVSLSARGVRVIDTPHPSPRLAAATRGRSLREVEGAFIEALGLLGE
jgi:hypothetical protein